MTSELVRSRLALISSQEVESEDDGDQMAAGAANEGLRSGSATCSWNLGRAS